MDIRLLPILTLMYILNAIDRNALPQARGQGLEGELGLVGNQYNIVLSLTFAGYVFGQVPSNMIMANISRPSRYLSAVMVAWGLLSAASGATQQFGSIAVCRLLLGLCEAPFFSGVAFLFSGWYTRKEIGKRLGIFFCGSMAAGAFGGLLSASIDVAFQSSSMSSWRWLFVVEGGATVVVASIVSFVVPDWPDTTAWLTEDEKALTLLRMREDNGEDGSNQVTACQAMRLAVFDHRVWLCILGQTAMQAVASLTNFLPSLVARFGQDEVNTLLLTAPPYAVTAVYSIIACFWSDQLSKRSPFIVFPTVAAMAGIVIMMSTANVKVRYAAPFLILPGTYGCFQVSNAWMANIAARPGKKRGISLALNNGIGNSALIWTPYLYASNMEPDFTLAWSVNLGMLTVLLGSTIVLSLMLQAANRRMASDNGGTAEGANHLRKLDNESAPGHWLRGAGLVEAASEEAGKAPAAARFDT